VLQEPENPYEEWSFEIFAKDLSTAQNQCQAIADTGELTDVLNVSQRSKTPNRQGQYRFICWFRSEVKHDDSDDPRN
jgi:hypothetical protein